MAGGYGTPSRHEGTLFFGLSHDIQWLKQGTPRECSPGGEENLYLGCRSGWLFCALYLKQHHLL